MIKEDEIPELIELLKMAVEGFDMLSLDLAPDSLTYAKMQGMAGMGEMLVNILNGAIPMSELRAMLARVKSQSQTASKTTTN